MKTYSLHEAEMMFRVRHDKMKLLCETFNVGNWIKDKFRLTAKDIYKLHHIIKYERQQEICIK